MRRRGLRDRPETSGAVGAVAGGWTRRSVRCGGPSRSASGAPAVRHQRWIPRSVHRGSTEQASNTARGTPKVRRTCGSMSTRQASVSRGAEARGSGGSRRSARPLSFRRRRTISTTGDPGARISIPRTAQRWLFAQPLCALRFGKSLAAHSKPSPLAGEGARAKRGRVRGLLPAVSPHPSPGSDVAALVLRHPLPQGERVRSKRRNRGNMAQSRKHGEHVGGCYRGE